MATVYANGVELHYEATGDGDPLVLVHGDWSDHLNWQPVVPGLSDAFRVIAYDRRGHGRSERPCRQGTRRDQEDDLAALIEGLGAPAHVAGTSFGASIAIGMSARRPELVSSLIAHEPPLAALVPPGPEREPVEAALAQIAAVLDRLERGDTEGAARQFVEEVALGPGAWEMLPAPLRVTMMENATAVFEEQKDQAWDWIDTAELSRITAPVLLSQGDASPPWFFGIVATLASAVPGARVETYLGAGHAPHVTHPDDYLRAVLPFLARASPLPSLPGL